MHGRTKAWSYHFTMQVRSSCLSFMTVKLNEASFKQRQRYAQDGSAPVPHTEQEM